MLKGRGTYWTGPSARPFCGGGIEPGVKNLILCKTNSDSQEAGVGGWNKHVSVNAHEKVPAGFFSSLFCCSGRNASWHDFEVFGTCRQRMPDANGAQCIHKPGLLTLASFSRCRNTCAEQTQLSKFAVLIGQQRQAEAEDPAALCSAWR